MINSVTLVGRITKDLQLKYTQSNHAFCNFTLAVNRNYGNLNGERKADFINCVVWRKQAENLVKYCQKGTMIGVEGNIQTRSYQDKEGKNVYITEILANSITFLEARKENHQQSPREEAIRNIDENDLPF